MYSLTITKSGRIELDHPIKVQNIGLKSITLFQTSYNLTTTTKYKRLNGDEITIPKGYYTYKELTEKLSNELEIDKNTLKVTYLGDLSGGLKDLIKDDILYLNPLSMYLYVDGIDTSHNFMNDKRSDLLSIIPFDKSAKFGDIITYQPIDNVKMMSVAEINSLNVKILDSNNNEYKGDFVAEIKLW